MTSHVLPRLPRRVPIIVAVILLALTGVAVAGYRQLNLLWEVIAEDDSLDAPIQPAIEGPVTLQWVGCDICKASFMEKAAARFEVKTGHKIVVEDGGASRGIWEVSRGEAHLGGTCRQCCLGEKNEDGVKLLPIAWDCLVVIVHKDNPLENITREQLRDIYTGKLTRWDELVGKSFDGPIVPLARVGTRSGVGFSVRQFLFQDIDKDYTGPSLRRLRSTRLIEEAMEELPRGIAISGYNSARLRLPPNGNLKMLRLAGHEPTRENVVNGKYLFYRPLYLSVPNNVHPVAQEFLTFLYSHEGQEILRETNTITLEEGKDLWKKYKDQMQSVAPRAAR